MRTVNGLDHAAADYEQQLTAAIAAAVAAEPYYRNTPAGTPAAVPGAQQPTALPPVPSGGDFTGGPRGAIHAEPKTVDDYREIIRRQKREQRGEAS